MFRCSGFRVYVWGLGVQELGFRFWGSGFRVWDESGLDENVLDVTVFG